jgi:cytochrome c553
MKEETVGCRKRTADSRDSFSRRLPVAAVFIFLLLCVAAISFLVNVRAGNAEHVPSYVAWTPETIAAASSGDAFRGMLLARRCEHCHGSEGFASASFTPNLAGIDRLSIWKQLQDFRSHKRNSAVMQPIADSLSVREVADVVAYYAALPVFPDPQDNRIFPQAGVGATHSEMAARLIAFGDGMRGIPPCQACHGPVAHKTGAPSLATQNTDYIFNQLAAFANGSRANDINEAMRTISALLSEEERHALAEYYGAGLGLQPGGAAGGK